MELELRDLNTKFDKTVAELQARAQFEYIPEYCILTDGINRSFISITKFLFSHVLLDQYQHKNIVKIFSLTDKLLFYEKF